MSGISSTSGIRVLLVDDDEVLRSTLTCVLEQAGFLVTTASNVPQALKHISSTEVYDVLLSDLNMPGAGDGLTVVSAMRHANPLAVTMLISANPQMPAAAQAILRQTDEILLKPLDVTSIAGAIHRRVSLGVPAPQATETVADILARTADRILKDCLARMQPAPLTSNNTVPREADVTHLALALQNIIVRLRSAGANATPNASPASGPGRNSPLAGATRPGPDRMHAVPQSQCQIPPPFEDPRVPRDAAVAMVEQFRLLQLSIFHTLQNHLANVDHFVLVRGIMTIADEIDAQLAQVLAGRTTESAPPTPLEAAPHGDLYQTA